MALVVVVCRLVLLLLVRELARFNILYVVRNRLGHNGVKVGITTQETWRKALVDAEHIVYYQNLTVASTTCSDTDCRD